MHVLLRADQRLQQNQEDLPCSSTKTIPIGERTWTDVEPQQYSPIGHPVSKKLINLLRHGRLPGEDDGAIEFWRLKIIFRLISCSVIIGLTKSGRKAWQEEEDTRKRFQYCADPSGQKIFISELFKVIQDAISLILHYRTMY